MSQNANVMLDIILARTSGPVQAHGVPWASLSLRDLFFETVTQTGYSRNKGNDKTKTGHKTGT